MRLVAFVPLCIALIIMKADTVLGKKGKQLSNLDFEGCLRPEDESGEPQRGEQLWKTQSPLRAPQVNKIFFTPIGHAPFMQTPKYNKANEPKYTIHPKNLNYKPPLIDTGFHSSQIVHSKELEDAIQNANRYTLNEWKEYGDQLKELLDLVDQGPSVCDTPSLGPPILDTAKRINHARDTVYHKLRYGTIRKTEDRVESEAEGEQE